jgi:hypothetical protein
MLWKGKADYESAEDRSSSDIFSDYIINLEGSKRLSVPTYRCTKSL